VICPELYDREGSPYVDHNGQEFLDNDLRFGRLGLAASEIAAGIAELGWKPDLVHVNDWPSAMAPAYMAWRGVKIPSILTVHNLAYQGLFNRDRMGALGIPDSAFQTDGVEFYGQVSFLKAGLYYASHLTTVSPTYAREILTPDSYNPQSDPHLDHHFDSSDFSGKFNNAAGIREAFGLSSSAGPLFAVVSRLVHQKGVDLVVDAANTILAQGGQVVATGQGVPKLEQAMMQLAERHPSDIGVKIGFDETVARRMYAGSDFLLMPSRYEPCGLSQMYAQRFGSLPIARKTGGLADTIQDNVTGFLFEKPSAHSLRHTILRALETFKGGRVMARMKSAAMQRPAGWHIAARRYERVYDRAVCDARALG
jgi:starch synthase